MSQNHPSHPFHQWETAKNVAPEGSKSGDVSSDTEFKLYSQKAISIATYLGGPLAAGILIRRNALNLGNEKQGQVALISGIISTALVFWGIFRVPEPIMAKIPNFLIPAIYTIIIYLIVEKLHGAILKKHKEEGNGFYSNWKAAGIGSICLIILSGAILVPVLSEKNWDSAAYNAGVEKFRNNEQEAMKLYDMLNANSHKFLISHFIERIGIPKWKDNIKILNEMSGIENMPEKPKRQIELLLELSKLRIESYELISKAIINETSEYDNEITKKINRIDKIGKELQNFEKL